MAPAFGQLEPAADSRKPAAVLRQRIELHPQWRYFRRSGSQHHHQRAFPVDPNIVQSTGGRSDSAIFFAVILQYIGFGFALDEAVAQAVRELRKSYPKSSYNCMIQSQDQFIALCAAGRESRPSALWKSMTSTAVATRRMTIV